MKRRAVYVLIVGLILASWIGNYAYSQYYRLPHPGFLRHYIETTVIPSVAFDLYYVANNDDALKPVGARIDDIPELKFYPLDVHQEMSRQTIYALRGYYDSNAMKEQERTPEPLRLHTATVFYNDGSTREEDIGEIVVYRDTWPRDTAFEAPVGMLSTQGSSNNDGSATVNTIRPVRLEGVTSVWLDKLGDALQFNLKPDPSLQPVELEAGQIVSLDYQFLPDREGIGAMEVYNVQLKENFVEPNGEKYDYIVFANAPPHPSEAQMRAYVREKRRQGG